jgi:hypothetical protein
MGRGRGQPRKYNKDQVKKLVNDFEKYINETDIPIIAEFAYMNDIHREIIYDYSEFSTLRKKAINKKEAQLEKLGLLNVLNPALAIFSLKQLGWRDKQEFNLSGELGVKVIDNIPEETDD